MGKMSSEQVRLPDGGVRWPRGVLAGCMGTRLPGAGPDV